eukprot:NODE_2645_length_1018_cov_68.057239_g2626_i0.p1 GENE.NODE_2645_length_1018_cov_68.057239_g2626_i0~~NODE_2645_length_1018_cov_68.057239_g2626_i0.p1  ORF type:complete len:263 (+),score=12.65 NODE_2645_length_1018_cov_68.057239_g2626_i0:92-880(+)
MEWVVQLSKELPSAPETSGRSSEEPQVEAPVALALNERILLSKMDHPNAGMWEALQFLTAIRSRLRRPLTDLQVVQMLSASTKFNYKLLCKYEMVLKWPGEILRWVEVLTLTNRVSPNVIFNSKISSALPMNVCKAFWLLYHRRVKSFKRTLAELEAGCELTHEMVNTVDPIAPSTTIVAAEGVETPFMCPSPKKRPRRNCMRQEDSIVEPMMKRRRHNDKRESPFLEPLDPLLFVSEHSEMMEQATWLLALTKADPRRVGA